MTKPQVVNRIAFRQAPAVDTVLMRDGQRYVVIDIRPYRRKDGTPTTLIVWRSHCSDCGQPFELTTPPRDERAQSPLPGTPRTRSSGGSGSAAAHETGVREARSQESGHPWQFAPCLGGRRRRRTMT